MVAIKTTFYCATIASCLSLLVLLAGGSWGPCGPATLPEMLAILVFPTGGIVTVLSGLVVLEKSVSQKRLSRCWFIHPTELGTIELSLSELEKKSLPPQCKSARIEIPLLDASTKGCLKSIVQQRFLTSDDVSKLELAARNLGVAVSSNEGRDSSYLTELALLVNRALKVAGR